MYLLPQSSHHPSLYLNIPFGVALRLRRICSRDDWFDEKLEEYHQFFKRKKYRNSVIRKRIKSVTTGKSYKIRQSLSCRTDYVIYCAICTLCNKQCVGSSIKFRSRLSNHKGHIKKNKRTCGLVNHFIDNSCSHTLSDLKFILIEQVTTKTEKFLEYREGYWQAQLWTCEPYGFNAKKEFNSGRGREFLS